MANANTNYPHEVLTPLHEPGKKPNGSRLLIVLKEVHENAAAIDSNYGDHGHSFLTQPHAVYTALNGGIPFNEPVHPGLMPTHSEEAPTQFTIAENNRQHAIKVLSWNKMRLTSLQLRNQLRNAADDMYWTRILDNNLGVGLLSVHDLINHMLNTYGQFTDKERNAATARLDTPWEGGPIEAVIKQINDGATDFVGTNGFNLTQWAHRSRHQADQ